MDEAKSYRKHIAERLAQSAPIMPRLRNVRPAAVLLPIIERDEPTVLFTLRTEHLPSHAGQVCFPGGRFHEEDPDLVTTALRELEEETGIAPREVEIAGFLDPYQTFNSGFLILPVVGYVRPGFTLKPNPEEVAAIFEVPLGYLLDPESREKRMLERAGVARQIYAIVYGTHTIWGATADMVVNFSDKMRGL